MEDNKQFRISIGAKSQVWDAEKYERNKDSLLAKYPEAQVEEVQLSSAQDDQVVPGNKYLITIGDKQQEWDSDRLNRNKAHLLRKYPDAKIESIKGEYDTAPEVKPQEVKENNVETNFFKGLHQTNKNIWGAGIKSLIGEAANLITGSGREEEAALNDIEYLESIGVDPVAYLSQRIEDIDFEKQYGMSKNEFEKLDASEKDKLVYRYDPKAVEELAAMRKNQEAVIKAYQDALEQAGGDLDKAKEILREKSQQTWGDKLIEEANAIVAENKELQGAAKWGGLAASAIPSAAALGLSFLTKGKTAGISKWLNRAAKAAGNIGMAGMSAGTAGLSMIEARQHGATNLQAWTTGIADGLIEFITEKIPFDKLTKPVLTAAKTKTAKALVEAMRKADGPGRKELEKLLTDANKKLGGKLLNGKNAADWLANAATEAASEATAEALQTVTSMIYLSPDEYPTFSEIGRNALEGAIGGLALGGVLGGAGKAVEHSLNKDRRKQQGFVNVALIEQKGKNPIVAELVDYDPETKTYKALQDGELVDVKEDEIQYKHQYTYNEFESGRFRQLEDEAIADGTVSDAQVAVSADRLGNARQKLENLMTEAGMTDEQKNATFAELEAGDLPGFAEDAKALWDAADEYTEAFKRDREIQSARDIKAENERKAVLDAMTQQMGGEFWQKGSRTMQDNGMEIIEPAMVEVGTLQDGKQVYILSTPNEVGEVSAVTEDGKKMFVRNSDLQNGTQIMPLQEFLDARVAEQKQLAEQARMAEEAAPQLDAIKQKYQMGASVELGTKDSPTPGVVVGIKPENDGVYIQTETGVAPYTYQQLADIEGTPIRVMTDAQMAAAEAAEIEAAESARMSELAETPEQMTDAETVGDNAVQMENMATETPLPLNPDGSVNQDALFKESPARWAEWNDERKQDGGASSAQYISGKLEKAQARLAELQTAYTVEDSLNKKELLEKAVAEQQGIVDELADVMQKYAPAETAPVQTESVQPAPAATQQERTTESVLASLNDGTLTDEEIRANIDANLAEAQKAYDKYAKKAPKMGTDKDAYLAEKQKYEQGLPALQQEIDFWNGVKQTYEGAMQQETLPTEESFRPELTEEDMEPHTPQELAARELGLKEGGIKLLWDSVKAHTGFGNGERQKFFGIFRSKDKGGMTIEAAGERLMEIDREYNLGLFDQNDPLAGVNAILDVLGDVQTIGDLRNYIANNREAQIAREAAAAYSAMNAEFERTHGMTMEEWAHAEEVARQEDMKYGLTSEDANELNNKFAEEENLYGTDEQSTGIEGLSRGESQEDAGNVEGGTDSLHRQGDSILQETQSAITGGETISAEQTNENVSESDNQDGNTPVYGAEQTEEVGYHSKPSDEINPLAMSAETMAKIIAERREIVHNRVKEWADKLGLRIRIIDSFNEVTNQKAKENISKGNLTYAWLERKTGEICIYTPDFIRSYGIDALSTEVDKTIFHEGVAHRGLELLLGKAKFNELCDYVWDNLMSKEKQAKFIKYPGVNGNKRAAADEYMAHIAEDVKYDSVWDKIADFFRKLLRIETKMSDKDIKGLLKQSYSNLKEKAQKNLEENGFSVDEKRDDVRFSSRYITTDVQRDVITDAISVVTGRSKEDAERWLQSEESAAALVLADKQYLDYVPDDKYKAIKDNSDYPQGTVDFNNICRKRVSFTKMFTRLQRRFPNKVFTADDLADIRTIMSKDGLTVACGLCYVEDRRQMVGEVAAFFIDQMQKDFVDYTFEVSAKDFAEGKAKRKKSQSKDKVKKAAKYKILIGNDTYVPNVYDLTTLEGLDKLYREHRGIWDAFQAFNSDRGQQSQNLFQGYAEYKREILSWSDAKVKKVNSLGGLRVFSYSDFEAHHLLDLIQIIIDCAARGVMIQGYTKVPEFARAVAMTGIKLNRSLIPLGDTGIIDGKLAFDPIEGIDVNDPNFLESNDNVGNILIGINDEQIRLAMANPFIHYIIPYHARQAEGIRAKLKVGNWVNYIDTQNERNVSDGKRVKKGINIYTDVLDESITNDRQFVEKYLEVCKKKGYIPKFNQFLDMDAEGNYVFTPGYHKFLVDFKLFDENGNILPQKPVVAEFDDAFNMQILKDYAEGERVSTGEQMNATYDKIVEALGLDESQAEGEDIRFRTRITPEQDKAYMDAVEAGDMETAQRMVIEAAKLAMPNTKVIDENGNPKIVYHQTNSVVYINRETGENWDELDWRARQEWDERDDWDEYWEEQDFNTFSRVNARTTNELDGFFFAPEYDEHHEYGDRTIPAFLNITSPASREDYDIDSSKNNAGREERIRLQNEGYDGVIREEDGQIWEYVAFEPSQIKSAEPVTYDDNGNVIPLSERFNEEKEDIRFKTANNNQAIFVSNAAKAVEGIKMEKATPEQWLKMIEKNGGLKAGEDKWLGLSDWLKASDKKTLTKQEVLDFVNEHMIIIEEQHYGINAEDDAERAHGEISERLQDKFDNYVDEYYQDHDWEDGETDNAREYAIEKLREEMGDTFPYTIELEHGSVYLTFPYEEEDDLVKWAEKTGVKYTSGVSPINDTRLNYTTDGLENKHEIALTVPTIERWGQHDDVHFGDAGDGRAVAWIRFGETQKLLGTTEVEGKKKFNWAKVLVIDEIQSKRHQEGREKGYSSDFENSAKLQELNAELEQKKARRKELKDYFDSREENELVRLAQIDMELDEVTNVRDYDRLVAERDEINRREENALAEFDMLANQINELEYDIRREKVSNDIKKETAIPDAPFDKNWHELAMKRMLRYAAENGFDVIAWTKGDQQAERYNIGDVVANVDYRLNDDGSYHVDTMSKLGYQIESIPTTFNSEQEIADVFGKEIAKKIVTNLEENKKTIAEAIQEKKDIRDWRRSQGIDQDSPEYEGVLEKYAAADEKLSRARKGYTLSESDFRIGGEGMKGFYDRMLPAFMNKYGKKWGVKVEDIHLNLEGGLDMHSVPVTEEMKESVMEGQTMFKTRQPNQSSEEFCLDCMRDYVRKYGYVTIIKVEPVNEATAKKYEYTLQELKELYGIYHKGIVVIFAKEDITDSEEVESTIFHESIHHLAKRHKSLIDTGKLFWNLADRTEELAEIREHVKKNYPDNSQEGKYEEMLCFTMEFYAGTTGLDFVVEQLRGQSKKDVELIINKTNYGRSEQTEAVRKDTTPREDGADNDRQNGREGEGAGNEAGEAQQGEVRFKTGIAPEVRQEMAVISAQAIVNGNYMKAPNGKDSKLTPEQWAMVRTKNFKRWFGDWENDPANASQVVDGNGEPMVVYHGTAGVINKFEDQQRSPGFWFVNREDVANGYAESASAEFGEEKNIIPVFLNIRNPRVEDAHAEYPAEFALKSYVENDNGVYEVFDTYEEAEAYREANVPDGWVGAAKVGDQHDLVERAMELGHDGVVMMNMYDQAAYAETGVKGTQTNYVVFDANQIKSATDNTGEFSEDADIRFKTKVVDTSKAVLKETPIKLNGMYRFKLKSAFKGIKDTTGQFGYLKAELHVGKNMDIPYKVIFSGSLEGFAVIYIHPDLAKITEDKEKEHTFYIDPMPIKDALWEALKAGVNYYEFKYAKGPYAKVKNPGPFGYHDWQNVEEDAQNESATLFKTRTAPAPTKTQDVYKLMRLGADGKLYPLFIGSAEPIELGTWYDAESPNLGDLTKLESGVHLVNNETGEAMTLDEFKAQHPEITIKGKRPNVAAINWATENGARWIEIEDKATAQRRYEGESRSYYNLGINGSGQVGQFAMRPGWHAGSLPTMRQIGKGKDKNLRDDSFVWVKGRISADVDYQSEADANPDKDIPTHIPTDGFYMKATNANAKASQADKMGWYVAGSFIADEIISDAEARSVIDSWNAEHPDARVEYDYERESGREYDPARGGLVEKEGTTLFKTTGTPTEQVVKDGLILSVEDFTILAGNIFSAMPEDVRRKVVENAARDNYDLKKATFQMAASLAEKSELTDEEIELAKMVAQKVEDAVIASGVEMTRPLTTNEALWMLYQSTNPLNESDPFSMAERFVVAHNLGFTESQQEEQEKDADNIRFRSARGAASNSAAAMYNNEQRSAWGMLRETYQDMYRSVKNLMQSIEKTTGKVAQSWENILTALNALSSKNLADKKKYLRDFLTPMWDAALAIRDKYHKSLEQIERYLMIKHGLERNKVLAARDARNFYREQADQEIAVIKADKSLSKADQKARIQKVEDTYDNHVSDIEAGIDAKFQEFRAKDYGGLTALFSDFADYGTREDYESEELYQEAALAARTPKYATLAETELAAQQEVDAFEKEVDKTLVDNLWKKINAATKETLRHQYANNMLTKEQYERVRDMFEFYVPLRGFVDTTAEDTYSYYVSGQQSKFANPLQGARGRKTQAETPLGWIGSMAESAIQMDNKNTAKLALYYFAVNRPNNDVLKITPTWYEWTGEVDADGKKIFEPVYPTFNGPQSGPAMQAQMDAFESMMEQQAQAGNAYKGKQRIDLKEAVIRAPKSAPEHVVTVKVAGEDYSIIINANPRAAQAINGMLNIDKGDNPLYRAARAILRFQASIKTSLAPLFWITNFMRDVSFAFINTSIRNDAGYTKEFAKNYPHAFRVFSYVHKNRKAKLGNSKYEKYYTEFAENGGITGYTSLTNNTEYDQMMKAYAKNARAGKLIKGIKGALEVYQDLGESFEQVSRFAAYITARESGKDISESIYEAKEVTINFNRKGSGKAITWEESGKMRRKNGKPLTDAERIFFVTLGGLSPVARSLFMFFNAGMQGVRMIAKLAHEHPGKSAAWAGIVFTMGLVNAIMHALSEDDDEYLDMPDYVRRTNILIGKNGTYFKWSLPHEVRPFYAMADIFVQHAMGRKPNENIATELAETFGEWMPINPFKDGIDAFTPDILRPFVEISKNKDFTGSPIYREYRWLTEEQQKNMPAYEKGFDSTSKVLVDISELLNDISGGDQTKAGFINVNPAAVEHLAQEYGGGPLKLAEQFFKTIGVMTGDQEFSIRNTPFLSTFMVAADDRYRNAHTTELFKYYKGMADDVKRRAGEYKAEKDKEGIDKLRASDDFQIFQIYRKYEKRDKSYNEQLKRAKSDSEKKEIMRLQDAHRKRMIEEISEL